MRHRKSDPILRGAWIRVGLSGHRCRFNLRCEGEIEDVSKPFVRGTASEVLKSKGFLAVFSNQHVRKDEGFFAEVQDLYDRYYPLPTENRPTHATHFPGVEAFQDSIKRVYPWTQTYSSEQYIKLLNTYSDHIALPDKNKRLLFEGIVNLSETKYDGQIIKHYAAVLDLRKKK